MSSAQPVDTTEDPQSGTVPTVETTGLAVSVMNRARWMQRVLSPWTQRWLASGDAAEAPGRSGDQQPFASLTGADTQRTLARMRVQYESHSTLETPTTGGSLPLAGAVERPAPAVESATPTAPRRAQGPYSKPFNSLDDFIHAIEAAKERDYAPPPSDEVQPRPASKHAVGPYSRPFQSMEEFVQAVNAAKERNYEPPPDVQPQPAPKREIGPYSKAFSSFEDFVKAVEETRSQWGQDTAEEAPAETGALPEQSETQPSMPTRVRPISRIEELPARTEMRSVSSPIDLPAPPADMSQPALSPKPVPTAQPAVPPARPAVPPTAAPQPAVVSAGPQVQRSPLESSADVSVSEEEVEPAVTPALQRTESSTRSEPAAPTASDLAEPSATSETDQVVQRLSQPTTPQPQPLDMPLVQRQAADSEATMEEDLSLDTAASFETDQPIVQRHVADTSSRPAVGRATSPSISEESPARAEEPIVQRQIAERSTQPVVGRTSTTQPEEPIGQRQTADTVQPEPVATPFAKPAMPLVQRHAADEALEQEEPVEESAPTVQRQVAEVESAAPELPAVSLPEASSSQPTLPAAAEPASPAVVQRQTTQLPTSIQRHATVPTADNHAAAPSSAVAPTRSTQLPLIQRQPATTPEPTQSDESLAEVPVDLPAASRLPVVPLLADKPAATPAADVDMPLVQRHAVETPAAEDEIDRTEEAVQRKADSSAPTPTPVVPPTAPDKPVVQRQVAEAKAATPVAPTTDVSHAPQVVQSGEKKIVAPLTDIQSPAARVEMPLVQRLAAETELEAAELDVAETAAEEITPAETVQRKATTETSPRSTATPAIKPAAPRVQRHAAEPIDTAQPVEPLGDGTQAVPSAVVESYASQDMPFVQRQPLEPDPAATASLPTVVQRSVARDASETEAATAQPMSDLSERILSRVAPPERRAVAKPIDLPLHHAPVQRESQPETVLFSQPVVGEHGPISSVAASPAPVIQRMAEPVIQRTPSESETVPSDTGFIQRVESVPAAAEQATESAQPPDLDQLARQVYPLIKRLIAIERERRAFR